MMADSIKRLLLGVLFNVAGLLLIIFRKAIRRADDNWNERVPWALQSHGPRGTSFEIFLILFGMFLLIAGMINLVLSLVQH